MVKLDLCYYKVPKFALEGMADNMHHSLRRKGIKVALVKPGNILTDMNEDLGESTTHEVAVDIVHAIASSNPKTRYHPGKAG
eukprot:2083346-Ditylum_brightwellii.AAC.1